jgi:hypothetical protein
MHDYELSDGRLLLCFFVSPSVDADKGKPFAATARLEREVDGCRSTPFTLGLDGVGWCLPFTFGGATTWFKETCTNKLNNHVFLYQKMKNEPFVW